MRVCVAVGGVFLSPDHVVPPVLGEAARSPTSTTPLGPLQLLEEREDGGLPSQWFAPQARGDPLSPRHLPVPHGVAARNLERRKPQRAHHFATHATFKGSSTHMVRGIRVLRRPWKRENSLSRVPISLQSVARKVYSRGRLVRYQIDTQLKSPGRFSSFPFPHLSP